MATVERYVDTDVVGGAGDGTSFEDAYSSLSAWEAAEQTNLVTDGDLHIVHCRASSGTSDSTAVLVDGWTTDATHNITIQVDEADRFNGEYDETAYRIVLSSSTYVFRAVEDYMEIYGLQFHNQVSGDSTSWCVDGIGEWGKLGYCLLSCPDDGVGLYMARTNTQYVYNCLFYNPHTEGSTAKGIEINSGTNYILNCTFHDFDDGVYTSGGDTYATNCISFDNADDFNRFGGSLTIDHCASDDGDGTNSVQPGDWTLVLTDYPNNVFSLKSTDTDCTGAGTDDPGSGLYSDDIVGYTRTSIWDIGAFENQVAAGSVVKLVDGVIDDGLVDNKLVTN